MGVDDLKIIIFVLGYPKEPAPRAIQNSRSRTDPHAMRPWQLYPLATARIPETSLPVDGSYPCRCQFQTSRIRGILCNS